MPQVNDTRRCEQCIFLSPCNEPNGFCILLGRTVAKKSGACRMFKPKIGEIDVE